MIDVADCADVDVRLAAVKFFFRHVGLNSFRTNFGAVDQD
jgi:hypothetical protein